MALTPSFLSFKLYRHHGYFSDIMLSEKCPYGAKIRFQTRPRSLSEPTSKNPGASINMIFSARHTLPCLIVMILCLLEFTMTKNSHADSLDKLKAGLPKHVLGWSIEADDRIYDSETIFDYINGGAEVYRAYNMRRCLSRRYTTSKGPDIVLDIFDMGSSQDAYGVFTHDLEGDVVALGQDGRLRPGWLNFWKNLFFVSIYTEEETPIAIQAVHALGKTIDRLIPTKGERPEILKLLPGQGLKSDSVRYLHHPIILNYHYYLSDTNLLNLSPKTEAVLANYQYQAEQALILLVSYPQTDAAANAYTNFLKNYLTDADNNGMAKLENNKWCAVTMKDRLLTIVLEADSRQLADKLLNAVR
jgi:hypothetical protein